MNEYISALKLELSIYINANKCFPFICLHKLQTKQVVKLFITKVTIATHFISLISGYQNKASWGPWWLGS